MLQSQFTSHAAHCVTVTVMSWGVEHISVLIVHDQLPISENTEWASFGLASREFWPVVKCWQEQGGDWIWSLLIYMWYRGTVKDVFQILQGHVQSVKILGETSMPAPVVVVLGLCQFHVTEVPTPLCWMTCSLLMNRFSGKDVCFCCCCRCVYLCSMLVLMSVSQCAVCFFPRGKTLLGYIDRSDRMHTSTRGSSSIGVCRKRALAQNRAFSFMKSWRYATCLLAKPGVRHPARSSWFYFRLFFPCCFTTLVNQSRQYRITQPLE